MSDRPEGSTRSPIPWGVIGLLIMVVLVERSLSRHHVSFGDPAATNFRYCKGAAAAKEAHAEILAVGTSMMKLGVVTRVIESETGRTAFNLAALNGHMPSSYFVLRRALESGARPKAVLIDCQDAPASPNPQDGGRFEGITANTRNWPELLDLRDTMDLAWVTGDSQFLAETLVARALPSYKARHEIRQDVLNAINGRRPTAALHNLALLRNWRVNRGAFLMSASTPPTASQPTPADRSPAEAKAADSTWSNRLTETYLDRVLELASAYQFRVFWVFPPSPPATQAQRDVTGLDEYFTGLAARVRSRDPNAVVIDARRAGYPADVFVDPVHLSAEGAAAFSAELAKIVKANLDHPAATGPWVSLAPYRRQAPTISYEDLAQSQLTVTNQLQESRRR